MADLKIDIKDFVAFDFIPEMHSHGHTRLCQLLFGPHEVMGAGYTNGERCETINSIHSDWVGQSLRMTPFGRHLTIIERFEARNIQEVNAAPASFLKRLNKAIKGTVM